MTPYTSSGKSVGSFGCITRRGMAAVVMYMKSVDGAWLKNAHYNGFMLVKPMQFTGAT